MRTAFSLATFVILSAVLAAPVPVPKIDWSHYDVAGSRNNANLHAKDLPDVFDPDPKKPLNLLWAADLGSRAYGQPVVAGNYILTGTNNERPRNLRGVQLDKDGDLEAPDKGILMCLDVATGDFVWQATHDKLATGQVNDWPKEGIVCSPCVEGGRVYYMSNRCELVCVDLKGFADGNQGDQKEQYRDPTDADILWKRDLIKDYGVFPHNMSASSPLVAGEAVFVITGNGVDENHVKIPFPDAPSFMAFDKRTGELLWKDSSPGKNIMHGQWSSPAFTTEPVPQVIFPAGDGWLYSFNPKSGDLLWKFDGNPKSAKFDLGGAGTKSDFVAMPVIHKGKLFIGTGQDPEHFTGVGHLWCLDLAKAVKFGKTNKVADVSPVGDNFDPEAKVNATSALEWHYGGDDNRNFVPRNFKFGRTMSNVVVVGDVIYACELAGYVHCLDARTGKLYWMYDLKGAIWANPLYADGKLYIGSEGGDVFIFDHRDKPITLDPIEEMSKEPTQKAANIRLKRLWKELEQQLNIRKIELDAPIRSTPIAVGATLYLKTENKLHAFRVDP